MVRSAHQTGWERPAGQGGQVSRLRATSAVDYSDCDTQHADISPQPRPSKGRPHSPYNHTLHRYFEPTSIQDKAKRREDSDSGQEADDEARTETDSEDSQNSSTEDDGPPLLLSQSESDTSDDDYSYDTDSDDEAQDSSSTEDEDRTTQDAFTQDEDQDQDPEEDQDQTDTTQGVFAYSTATYNINGVAKGTPRYGPMKKNVQHLAKTHGIIMIQQTRWKKKDQVSFKEINFLPKWGIFRSNCDLNHAAGVATLLSPEIMELYDVTQETVIEDYPELRGRALRLKLTPKDPDDPMLGEVSLLNLYLPPGTDQTSQALILGKLTEILDHSGFQLVAGDFNFVTEQGPGPSNSDQANRWTRGDYSALSAELRRKWEQFASKFRLKEVHQTEDTYFHIVANDTGKSVTSKLDRIYTSHSQAELSLIEGCGHIAHVPNNLMGGYERQEGKIIRTKNHSSSDHAPVSAMFATIEVTNKRRARVPHYVMDHPMFDQHFADNWRPAASHVSAEAALLRFKAQVFKTATHVVTQLRGQARTVTQAHQKLATAIAALRICHKSPYDKNALKTKLDLYPHLKPLLSNAGTSGPPQTNKLKEFIDNLLVDNATETNSNFATNLKTAELKTGTGIRENFRDIRKNTQKTHEKSIIEHMKMWLPSQRTRLKALRKKIGDAATNCPNKMAKIAQSHYSKLWSRQPKVKRLNGASYLGKEREIPDDLKPKIPDDATIADIIIGTNNSCPGPDRIPFKVYRILVRFVAPILGNLLRHFARGGLPSSSFNDGALYLLLKRSTLLPEDTRPISVTNADNRIIAKILVYAIKPYLTSLYGINSAQKGGISGRHGIDHVNELCEKFYTAFEQKGGAHYHILFMDTKKAFDSIHHTFIYDVLVWFGMPWWVINVVTALLHDVTVTPQFGQTCNASITIARGVKQGCPFSPWLFAMVMDVLLHKLSCLPEIEPFAFVDDLALGTTDFKLFRRCMKIIQRFSNVSGLGVNYEKTQGITSAQDGAFEKWAASNRCIWPEFKIVLRYKYLGFLMGKWTTQAMVFKPAYDNFRDRMAAYRSTFRRLSPARRVTLYNCFAFPLFSYIAPIYGFPAMGTISEATVRRVVRRVVISYGGNAFPYENLIAPHGLMGLATPLKDLWAYSVSLLAAQADLTPYQDITSTQKLPKMKPSVSMRPSRQIQDNGRDFVQWELYLQKSEALQSDSHPKFDAGKYSKLAPKKRRSTFYNILIRALLVVKKREVDLRKKMTARGLPTSQRVSLLCSRFRLLSTRMPAKARYYQMALLHNAVSTGKRNRRFLGNSLSQVTCTLCKSGSDSIEHYHGGECVDIVARRVFSKCIGYDVTAVGLQASTHWQSSFLLFKVQDHARQAVNAIVALNYATYVAHLTVFKLRTTSPTTEQAVASILKIALGFWARVRLHSWSTGERCEGITPLATKTTLVLGNSSNRTPLQKQQAKAKAHSDIQATEPNSVVIFTDGSANPNPGPCGAGVALFMPQHRGQLRTLWEDHTTSAKKGSRPPSGVSPPVSPFNSTLPDWYTSSEEDSGTPTPFYPPLQVTGLLATKVRTQAPHFHGPLVAYSGILRENGEGTNNIGEIWAVGMALDLLAWHETQTGEKHQGPIYVFSDSQLTIDLLTYKARPRANQTLIHRVRAQLYWRNITNPVHMYWVAGHVGVFENELADNQAELGSAQAATGHGLWEKATLAAGAPLLPPNQTPYQSTAAKLDDIYTSLTQPPERAQGKGSAQHSYSPRPFARACLPP